MNISSKYPIIYEINTWVWLADLGRQYGGPVTLDTVPAHVWDDLADLGIDALWLMGVWERSPAGIRIASQDEGLFVDFIRALPDFSPEDVVGSPYCIRRYVVDAHLGGQDGLAEARLRLAERNIALILDFVPNHIAPDHPWVAKHPEFFIQGDLEDFRKDPASFMPIGNRVFACGRDPHYPAWPDVLQLNAFHPEVRKALISTITDIAGLCDGIRCDMAMLVMNSVYAQTWGLRAGPQPAQEFWPELICAVRTHYPSFLFLAEAYWDLEWQLQQQGFDFCYDKRLYDRLEHGNAESVRLHLCADGAYQKKLIRFIENHDEPRAATAFPVHKTMAAAVTISTIPGARLFHDGQFEGRRIRIPVSLGRRPVEPLDPDIQIRYHTLLDILKSDCLRNGQWRLCERTGRPDAAGDENLIAWCWKDDTELYLIVVNLSDREAQGQVRPAWGNPVGEPWTDLFTGNVCDMNGGELSINLPTWGFHILKCW
jgi:hypothetical protein